MTVRRGSCACGAVTFAVDGDLPAPDACHCRTCRKTTGHFLVSTDVARGALRVEGGERVRWYASSAAVRRGFCGTCGATLFWDPPARGTIAIAMGAFDDPTDTRVAVHVHAAEKGDYYAIDDGAPVHATVPAAGGGHA